MWNWWVCVFLPTFPWDYLLYSELGRLIAVVLKDFKNAHSKKDSRPTPEYNTDDNETLQTTKPNWEIDVFHALIEEIVSERSKSLPDDVCFYGVMLTRKS